MRIALINSGLSPLYLIQEGFLFSCGFHPNFLRYYQLEFHIADFKSQIEKSETPS
jgi:hypothetical protein